MSNISLAGFTILLAEDSSPDIELFNEAYAAAQLSNPLQIVRDGVEAVEYLSGHGKYADRNKYAFPILLLLDWKMPRMDGLETLTWIRKEENIKNLWVVMLTSEDSGPRIDQAYEMGANSYFVKPGKRVDWAALIERLHGHWLILPRPAESILKLTQSSN
jgi:CheY-like chemotaxis protein